MFLYSFDCGGVINPKTLECLVCCAYLYDNTEIMKQCSDYLEKNKQYYEHSVENTLRFIRSWEALFDGNLEQFKAEYEPLMNPDTKYMIDLRLSLNYASARYSLLCGNTEKAAEYFSRIPKSLYTKENSVFGARCLALKYELEGRQDKAAEIWKKFSESFPENPVYQRELQLIGKK